MSITTPEKGTTPPNRGTDATQDAPASTLRGQSQTPITLEQFDLDAKMRSRESDVATQSNPLPNILMGQESRAANRREGERRQPDRGVFNKLELREGLVLAVDEDSFRARLVDPEDEAPDEEIDIFADQVSPSDLELLRPGALFFWAIGYVTRNGTRELVCRVSFRRRAVTDTARRKQAFALAATLLRDVT